MVFEHFAALTGSEAELETRLDLDKRRKLRSL